MSEEQLSQDIREFLAQYILTVGHLEILLFLYEGRNRAWSVQELSQNMRTNHSMVERHLYDLRDFVQVKESAEFQFAVGDEGVIHRLERAATLYRTHKHAIISEIYSRSLGAIRSFADAFRIKKDE